MHSPLFQVASSEKPVSQTPVQKSQFLLSLKSLGRVIFVLNQERMPSIADRLFGTILHLSF